MTSPQLTQLLISAGCLAGAGVLALRYLRRRRAQAAGESAHTPADASSRTPEPSVAASAAPWNGGGMIFGAVTPVLASLLPESEQKRQLMKRELVNAGYYHPRAADNLAAIRYLGIVLPIIGFGVLFLLAPRELELAALLAGVVAALLGWALPSLIVRSRAAERRDEITRAMPDMLDMLNMCVSQGMTLTSSLSRVIREIETVYPALAHELRIVTEQARVGSVEQALQNFADRVDVPEVHSFTSTLIQTERMGTSVSAALADHSDNIRESRKQRADQAANMATFKLLFPTALCLMPAVFLFLLGPALVDLSDFFDGEAGEAFRSGRAAATQTLQRPTFDE